MIRFPFLLTTLLMCHYLADFCFTFPAMIKAKADGRNPWPIMLHTGIHAGLVGISLLLWGVSWNLLLMLALLEFVSHFLIDTAKGQLTAHYSILGDTQKKPHWMLYGLDQLLHLLVIVMIWYYCVE